eukprot:scaffold14737_cov68-Phaeocystis_antarctica.AAC.7
MAHAAAAAVGTVGSVASSAGPLASAPPGTAGGRGGLRRAAHERAPHRTRHALPLPRTRRDRPGQKIGCYSRRRRRRRRRPVPCACATWAPRPRAPPPPPPRGAWAWRGTRAERGPCQALCAQAPPSRGHASPRPSARRQRKRSSLFSAAAAAAAVSTVRSRWRGTSVAARSVCRTRPKRGSSLLPYCRAYCNAASSAVANVPRCSRWPSWVIRSPNGRGPWFLWCTTYLKPVVLRALSNVCPSCSAASNASSRVIAGVASAASRADASGPMIRAYSSAPSSGTVPSCWLPTVPASGPPARRAPALPRGSSGPCVPLTRRAPGTQGGGAPSWHALASRWGRAGSASFCSQTAATTLKCDLATYSARPN